MIERMISSSVLIVLVIAMRHLFRKKLPMRAWYALWLVVAVRLLVPVSFAESGLSVLNLFAFMESGEGTEIEGVPETGQGSGPMYGAAEPEMSYGMENQPGAQQTAGLRNDLTGLEVNSGIKAAPEADMGVKPMDGKTAPVPAGESAAEDRAGLPAGIPLLWKSLPGRHPLLWYVWLLGAGICACCVLIMNGRYRRKVHISRRRYRADTEVGLPVYVSPVVESPCMFGLMRPAVYLSTDAIQRPEAIRYVLCHENVHYSHHDNRWVVLRAACLCLHWYNPFVWIAAALSEQDGELACDERTLELLGQEERIRYGRALLDFSAQGSAWQRGWKLSTAMSSGKKLLKERLLVIVGEPRRHAGALAGVMLLTALCAAVTFTGRVSGQEAEDADLTDLEGVASENMEGIASQETGGGNGGNPSVDAAESTATVSINGHILKISGEAIPGSGLYRIDQIEVNQVRDRREETLQTIRPEDMRVLYTRPLEEIRSGRAQMYSYTSDEEPRYAKALVTVEDLPAHEVEKFLADGNGQIFSKAPDESVLVADLNFDGYQDFCLQDGTGETANIPCYCYLWNPDKGQFEPGYMIPNAEVDQEAQLIKSATDDGNGQRSVKYYRFDESNVLHMVRYVEENQSPDAVFPALDLTYCEMYYGLPAVDEWDYGARYGGALTERFVYWAKEALKELYEWSGTKIDKTCFTMTSFGNLLFANTPEQLEASLTFYDRGYGERAGFEDLIEQMNIVTERTVWFSPVIQWNKPDNINEMSDMQLVQWYFERSPLSEGEKLESLERIDAAAYTIKAESGRYYQIFLTEATRELSSMYGPYENRPE